MPIRPAVRRIALFYEKDDGVGGALHPGRVRPP